MSKFPCKHLPLLLCAPILAMVLSACAVVGSVPNRPSAAADAYPALSCSSKLGSYVLPKAFLKIKITGSNDSGYKLVDPETERTPESELTFCLDHLSTIVADDMVWARKQYKGEDGIEVKTPYLQLVAANAKDQSVEIVRKLLRAAFILISNDGGFTDGRSVTLNSTAGAEVVADHKVDPFDQYEMSEINDQIRHYGFCIMLDGFAHRKGVSPKHYCNSPKDTVKKKPSKVALKASKRGFHIAKPVSGIFYRPRSNYRLLVYTNSDPDGRTPWELSRIKRLHMENISPILSVGLDRAIFAQQLTAMLFDDGMLEDVCIARGSAVANVVNIPLDLIYGIIALPSRRIQAATTDYKTQNALYNAEQGYIKAQNDYIGYLQNRGQVPDDLKTPGQDPVTLGLGTTADINRTETSASATLPNTTLNGDVSANFNSGFSKICDLSGRFPSSDSTTTPNAAFTGSVTAANQ